MIDAGENSKIIFEIMNEGRNPVYNVVPVVETVGKVKHLGISPSVMVEEILPGEGVICDSQEFTLPTQRGN